MANTEAERITKLEAKSEAYDKILAQNADTLVKVSDSLKQLVVLEERHQALDRRHEVLREEFLKERDRATTRDYAMETALHSSQSATDMNTHGRSLWEKVLVPSISGLVTGLTVGVVLFLFTQTTGT